MAKKTKTKKKTKTLKKVGYSEVWYFTTSDRLVMVNIGFGIYRSKTNPDLVEVSAMDGDRRMGYLRVYRGH
jgi:hypothetical protein